MKRADVQMFDPLLGRSVKNGATDTCSKCAHTIPEEAVPLMVWNDSGTVMWVICEACEPSILPRLMRGGKP
jgi:hypothetical protein